MGQSTTSGMPDPRRLVPRTDTVLGDPRLVDAACRMGTNTVKEAVRRAQERARQGEIAPDAVADEAVAGLPRAATSLRPGGARGRGGAARGGAGVAAAAARIDLVGSARVGSDRVCVVAQRGAVG